MATREAVSLRLARVLRARISLVSWAMGLLRGVKVTWGPGGGFGAERTVRGARPLRVGLAIVS